MSSAPFRDGMAALERVAVLEAENAELRAKVAAAASEETPYDDRDVKIRRLEQERDALKKKLGQIHGARSELTEQELAHAKELVEGLRRERTLLEEKVKRLERDLQQASWKLEKLEDADIERDKLAKEVEELRPQARAVNETAFVRRLTEERDELLAEVRALRERV